MSLINLEYIDIINGVEKKRNLEFSSSLITKVFNRKSLFVIKVEGESMQPLIQNSALVVADLSQKDIVENEIYLLFVDNNMWIKQARVLDGKIEFISINKAFSHLIYKGEDVRVIAKALLTFTNL